MNCRSRAWITNALSTAVEGSENTATMAPPMCLTTCRAPAADAPQQVLLNRLGLRLPKRLRWTEEPAELQPAGQRNRCQM